MEEGNALNMFVRPPGYTQRALVRKTECKHIYCLSTRKLHRMPLFLIYLAVTIFRFVCVKGPTVLERKKQDLNRFYNHQNKSVDHSVSHTKALLYSRWPPLVN